MDKELQLELIKKWDGKLPTTYICDKPNQTPLSVVLKAE